jgi:ketosteroid isomerase-like protein
MRRYWIAIALAVLATMPAAASDKTDALAVVRQFVNAFNQGDAKAALAACASETSIIDEFPPHQWDGTGACSKWMSDYDADAKKNGITDGKVTLGTPRHVDVTAGRAYVVVPANYFYKQKGKPMQEIDSMLTIVLHKENSSWRITAWAWTKH